MGVRNTDRLQILSWNPGPPRGDDHSAVANHICGPWHFICLQEGAGVANHPTLHHRFHAVTGCFCAVLLNKDTCERDVTPKPVKVPAEYYADCALEGIAVKGRFRRPVVGDWHYFSILNVHVNLLCAARLSICFKLLFLVSTSCVQEGVALLAGDFYKGAQRGRLGEPYPLEASFSRAPVPWRRLAAAPTVGFGRARSGPIAAAHQAAAHQPRVAHQKARQLRHASHAGGRHEDGPILPLGTVDAPPARSSRGDEKRPTSLKKQPQGPFKDPAQT